MPSRTRGAALFIGVNKQIDGARVRHAEADAEAMHRTMTHPDIGSLARARTQVLKGQEATRKSVAEALVRLAKLADSDNGWLVVYFAGHAVEVGGDVYLGLADFDRDAIDSDPAVGLCLSDLGSRFLDRRRGIGRVLVILDCCFGGAIAQDLASWRGRSAEMIFAAGPTSLAMEHDNLEHGVLTAALLAGLAGEAATQAGDVTPESLYAFARERCATQIGHAGVDLGLPPLILTSPGCQIVPIRARSSSSKKAQSIRARGEDFGPVDSDLTRFQTVFQHLVTSSAESWAAKKTGQLTMREALQRLLAALRSETGATHAVVLRMAGAAAVPVASSGEGAADLESLLGDQIGAKLFDLMGAGHLFHRRQFGFFDQGQAGHTLVIPIGNDKLANRRPEKGGAFLILTGLTDGALLPLTESFAAAVCGIASTFYDGDEDTQPATQALDCLRVSSVNPASWMFEQRLKQVKAELNHARIVFQPIVSIAVRPSIVSWEALLRTSTGGAPAGFLHSVELWGPRICADVDATILAKTLAVYRRLRRQGDGAAHHGLSVNCYASSLLSDHYIETLRSQAASDDDDFACTLLQLEISEKTAVPVENPGDVTAFSRLVDNLRLELGVSFATDDFGVGASNLARLSDLPLSTIKIDRSVLYASFATDVIELARRIALRRHSKVVVEGWDTDCELTLGDLRRLKVDGIQGYGIRRPEERLRPLEPAELHHAGFPQGGAETG